MRRLRFFGAGFGRAKESVLGMRRRHRSTPKKQPTGRRRAARSSAAKTSRPKRCRSARTAQTVSIGSITRGTPSGQPRRYAHGVVDPRRDLRPPRALPGSGARTESVLARNAQYGFLRRRPAARYRRTAVGRAEAIDAGWGRRAKPSIRVCQRQTPAQPRGERGLCKSRPIP